MDYLLLIFFVIILLFSLAGGAMRGYKREIGRIIFIAVSGVVSLLLSKPVVSFIVNKFNIESIVDLEAGTLAELVNASSTLKILCEKLTVFIAAPIIFFLLYIVLCFINLIIGSIVMSGIPKEGKMKGLALGIVAAVLSFTIFCAPMATILMCGTDIAQSIPDDYVSVLEEKFKVEELEAKAQEYVDVKAEDAVNKTGICRSLNPLGKFMLREMSGQKINGTHIALSDELYNLRFVLGKAVPLLYQLEGAKEVSWMDLIPDCIDALSDSELMKKVLPELASAAALKWEAGESFAGIEADSSDVFKSILVNYVLKNKDNITKDGLKDLFESLNKAAGSIESIIDGEGKIDIEKLLESEEIKAFLKEYGADFY